jgi:hypothetical protein
VLSNIKPLRILRKRRYLNPQGKKIPKSSQDPKKLFKMGVPPTPKVPFTTLKTTKSANPSRVPLMPRLPFAS